MKLTEKECTLLEDLKGQEKLCIEKYSKYAGEASDRQLTDLFRGIASVERQHYETLSAIGEGKSAGTGGSSGNSASGSGSGSTPLPQSFTKAPSGTDAKTDAFLCSDLLSTEKHASHLYDTCVFEFADTAVRQTLGHIQQEEQTHGKLLYDYMKVNGMYSG